MRTSLVVVVLLGTRLGAADPPAVTPYASLFVKNATWKLGCIKDPTGPGESGSPSPDVALECKATEVQTIGDAKLVHLVCTGNTANPTGWYAMIDRGLYHLDRFHGNGTPPRPKARWEDSEAPAGSFRAADVARLRAQRPWMAAWPVAASWKDPPHPSGWTGGGATTLHGDAWCSEEYGANGGGGEARTLCVSKSGLAGTGWETGESVFSYRCGALAK